MKVYSLLLPPRPSGLGTARLTILGTVILVILLLASDSGAPRAQDTETAEEVFRHHISGPII